MAILQPNATQTRTHSQALAYTPHRPSLCMVLFQKGVEVYRTTQGFRCVDFLLRGGMCIAQELSEETSARGKTRPKVLSTTAHHEVGQHHGNDEKPSTINRPNTDPLLNAEMSRCFIIFGFVCSSQSCHTLHNSPAQNSASSRFHT
jgi:hypothetical protein